MKRHCAPALYFGRSPFSRWLRALNVDAATKVTTALERIAHGNLSNVKTAGNGILEYKIDLARLPHLFCRDGERPVILLAGVTKRRQQEDIRRARGKLGRLQEQKTPEYTRWH